MCGLYGLINYGQKLSGSQMSEVINALARESEIRGSHATGIAYINKGRLVINKAAKPAHAINFRIPDGIISVIGHTRHSTQGSEKKNINNHPFAGYLGKNRQFALAHNGIIYNDSALRRTLKLPKTKIETDSYIAVQLVESKGKVSFDSLKYMAETVNGSFTFTLLDDCKYHYIVKGDSPISLIHFTQLGLYAYASTDNILYRALAQTMLLKHMKAAMNREGTVSEVEVKDGTIVRIDKEGNIDTASFDYDAFSGYGFNWWDCSTTRSKPSDVEDCLAMLRMMAIEAGYDSKDVPVTTAGFHYAKRIQRVTASRTPKNGHTWVDTDRIFTKANGDAIHPDSRTQQYGYDNIDLCACDKNAG